MGAGRLAQREEKGWRPLSDHQFSLSADELRNILIFLSVAKTPYEHVGRLTGDAEDRFSQHRMAIEAISSKLRQALMEAMTRMAASETPAEIVAPRLDGAPVPPDIPSKEPARRAKLSRRRK